jgi:hypothetical protein
MYRTRGDVRWTTRRARARQDTWHGRFTTRTVVCAVFGAEMHLRLVEDSCSASTTRRNSGIGVCSALARHTSNTSEPALPSNSKNRTFAERAKSCTPRDTKRRPAMSQTGPQVIACPVSLSQSFVSPEVKRNPANLVFFLREETTTRWIDPNGSGGFWQFHSSGN